jgi:hypothetical protein
MTEPDLHYIQCLDGLTQTGQQEIDLNHNLSSCAASAKSKPGFREARDGAQLDHDIEQARRISLLTLG